MVTSSHMWLLKMGNVTTVIDDFLILFDFHYFKYK